MENSTKVGFVILNWNGVNDTLECLQSVYEQDYPNFDVVVVDNASSDNSVEILTEKYPNIFIIKNQVNLGYAEGNNLGLNYAAQKGSDYLFVLNNDVVLKKDCLSELVSKIKAYPETAAIAPISFYYDQPDEVDFAGGRISSIGTTLSIKKSIKEIKELNEPYSTTWLLGCAMLIPQSVYNEVGGFDPRFFLLFEDSDWSLRARKMGYILLMAPESWIYHKVSRSFERRWSPTYFYYYTRNNFLFFEKNFSYITKIKLSIFQFLRLAKLMIKLIDEYPREKRVYFNSFYCGLKDYIFRKFGKANDRLRF
jgi:hypothetical protein